MVSLSDASQHADLGLPVPRGARFRTIKRVVSRLQWMTNHRQVAFNHAVLALIAELQVPPPAAADQVFAEQIAVVRTELAELVSAHAELNTLRSGADARVAAITDHLERLTRSISDLSSRHEELRSRVETEVRRVRLSDSTRLSAAAAWSDEGTSRSAPEMDPELVVELHDAFRGPYLEIRQRLEVYRPALSSIGDGRVLDVGAGRGELLDLLQEAGTDAYGLEPNPLLAERCRARGLEVLEVDALEHLAKVADAALGAVTAIHVVEHLSFPSLVALLDEVRRALRPGGVVVIETPNADNLIVSASTFYLDPTHLRPLPAELLRNLLIGRGFTDVQVMPLHPAAAPLEPPVSGRDPTATIVATLNERIYGPRDIGLVARRPDDR